MAANRGTQGVLQVGPEQLLAGAQRAEAEGHLEYAAQLYRQLAEAYPTTREAYDARDALARMSAQAQHHAFDQYQLQAQPAPAPQLTHQLDPHHPGAPPGPGRGGWTMQHVQSPQQHGAMGAPYQAAHDQQHAPAMRREGARKARPAKVEREPPSGAGLAAGYRTGRLVAMMLASTGWLLLIGSVFAGLGLILALTVGVVPRGLRELAIKQLPFAIGGTVGMLALGLLSVFAGQVAKAIFDTAEAVRNPGDRPEH